MSDIAVIDRNYSGRNSRTESINVYGESCVIRQTELSESVDEVSTSTKFRRRVALLAAMVDAFKNGTRTRSDYSLQSYQIDTLHICCPRDFVSRHNGGTSGAPLKPLRDDSALRALSTLRGLRGFERFFFTLILI